MELQDIDAESLSLVCLGSFAPGVVQPSWLARNDLTPRLPF
jgi:hypothetical protein